MWLSPRDLAAPGVRLFCLPHAGSGAAGFYRWKRLLPATVAVCPVLLPGREARLGEPSLLKAAAIVEELHKYAAAHLHGPYAIFGHSMGALLAYEWTRCVAAAGLRMPVCLFVSGRNAPQMGSGHSVLHRLEPESFVHELKTRYGGEPEALLRDPELREVFLPILRGDLEVVETYRWDAAEALGCNLCAFAGTDDRSVSEEGLTWWGELTSMEFESRRFPGDHFYHFGAGQAKLLRVIEEVLASEAPSSSPAGD